jgi:hypothetical protein
VWPVGFRIFTGMQNVSTRFELKLPPQSRAALDALSSETGLSCADLVRLSIRRLERPDLLGRGSRSDRAEASQ